MRHSLLTTVLVPALVAPAVAQNRAISLDGIDDAIFVNSDPSLTVSEQFTIEAWVHVDDETVPFSSIFTRAGGPPQQCYYNFGFVANDDFNVSTGFGEDMAGPPMTFDSWTHYAWTHDPTGDSIFVNGELAASGDLADPAASQDSFATIGVETCLSPEYLNGDLDRVRLWNVARDEQDIRQTINLEITPNEVANYPGLVASYNFQDDLTDATGVNNGIGLGNPTFFDANDIPVLNFEPGTKFCFCEGRPLDPGDVPPPDNNPDPNAGCANREHNDLTGATLCASGSVSLSNPQPLTLHVAGATHSNRGFFFAALEKVNGDHGTPFGRGHLCLLAEETMSIDTGPDGSVNAVFEHTTLVPTIGETFIYQYVYREKDKHPNVQARNDFNLTNAYEVTWQP